jgi:hypothetical protein
MPVPANVVPTGNASLYQVLVEPWSPLTYAGTPAFGPAVGSEVAVKLQSAQI